MSAQNDLLLVDMLECCPPSEVIERLGAQLPEAMAIQRAENVKSDVSCIPAWAKYRITLRGIQDRWALAERIEKFLNAKDWPIVRNAHGRHCRRTLDMRSAVAQLELDEKGLLCTINIEPEATVRVDELLEALEINDVEYIEEIRRIAVGYPAELINAENYH